MSVQISMLSFIMAFLKHGFYNFAFYKRRWIFGTANYWRSDKKEKLTCEHFCMILYDFMVFNVENKLSLESGDKYAYPCFTFILRILWCWNVIEFAKRNHHRLQWFIELWGSLNWYGSKIKSLFCSWLL